MSDVQLYDLGDVPWLESQLIYHALPRLGREGLIILAPASPYVCIGYHQDLAAEVDVPFCQAHGIPVFRREVGGGAVYLDGDQLFYQLVLHRDHPLVPRSKAEFYQRFLAPVVATYQAIGIPAQYRPVNDIAVHDRKISGTGVGEIEDFVVLVGNLILDFNYEMMACVLKVPDEKFRNKVYKTMQDNLTTIQRELGQVPPVEKLEAVLIADYRELLGPLPAGQVDEALRAEVARLSETFLSETWLFRRGRRQAEREVTVGAGVEVRERLHKAPGGLVRAITATRDGVILSVSFSGDFYFYPAGQLADLECALAGVARGQAEETIARFYRENGVESPGLTPADLAQVL